MLLEYNLPGTLENLNKIYRKRSNRFQKIHLERTNTYNME